MESPVDPKWAAPTPAALDDLHWLALDDARRRPDDKRAAGIADTITWLRCGGKAPLTGRIGKVTRRVVSVEHLSALPGLGSQPRLDWHSAREGVAYQPPRPTAREYAEGVYTVTGWALGHWDGAPIPLPARANDGHLLAVDELIAAGRAKQPAQVHALLAHEAELTFERSQRLATRVADVRERLLARS